MNNRVLNFRASSAAREQVHIREQAVELEDAIDAFRIKAQESVDAKDFVRNIAQKIINDAHTSPEFAAHMQSIIIAVQSTKVLGADPTDLWKVQNELAQLQQKHESYKSKSEAMSSKYAQLVQELNHKHDKAARLNTKDAKTIADQVCQIDELKQQLGSNSLKLLALAAVTTGSASSFVHPIGFPPGYQPSAPAQPVGPPPDRSGNSVAFATAPAAYPVAPGTGPPAYPAAFPPSVSTYLAAVPFGHPPYFDVHPVEPTPHSAGYSTAQPPHQSAHFAPVTAMPPHYAPGSQPPRYY